MLLKQKIQEINKRRLNKRLEKTTRGCRTVHINVSALLSGYYIFIYKSRSSSSTIHFFENVWKNSAVIDDCMLNGSVSFLNTSANTHS